MNPSDAIRFVLALYIAFGAACGLIFASLMIASMRWGEDGAIAALLPAIIAACVLFGLTVARLMP